MSAMTPRQPALAMRTSSAHKSRNESIAQLAAAQFATRKKGIKMVLTASNASAKAAVLESLSKSADRGSRLGSKKSNTSNNYRVLDASKQGSHHSIQKEHTSSIGAGSHAFGRSPINEDRSDTSSSFSFLDLEGSKLAGLTVYQKKMVMNARRKPKFDESVLKRSNPKETRLIMLDDRLRNGAAGYARNAMQTAKYTVATFIPICLYEQIFLPINILFFILILINLMTTTYVSSFLPVKYEFIIWISFRVLKEWSEDLRRARADGQENAKRTLVLDPNQLRAVATSSSFVSMSWGDIVVGDIVQVMNGERFPSDMVLLATEPLEGQHDGECFVDSSNVDGDENLKLKRAIEVTSIFKTGTCLRRLKGALSCENPNTSLSTFGGIIGLDVKEAAAQMQKEEMERFAGMPLEQTEKVKRILKQELSRDVNSDYSHVEKLSPQNLVLRGTRLTYTESATGVVVYAGHDCKVARNWLGIVNITKRSHLMKTLDHVTILLLAIRVLYSSCSAIGNSLFSRGQFYITLSSVIDGLGLPHLVDLTEFWPMDLSNRSDIVISWSYFFFMYGGVLSLSIWITLDLVGFSQGVSIGTDQKLWDHANNLVNKASMITSNVNADLGQVEHILTDKHGLLTSGKIEVCRININGVEYAGRKTVLRDNESYANLIDDIWNGNPERSSDAKFTVTMMAICNSITSRIKLPKEKREMENRIKRDEQFFNKSFEYRSSSPYEIAMVEAAKSFGYEFKSRKGPVLRLSIKPINQPPRIKKSSQEFELLAINSMSSRGRMSVVVKYSDTEIYLYCKGWPKEMIDRCVDIHCQRYDVLRTIERYRRRGYRTMVMSKRKLPLTYFYNVWLPLYHKARHLDPRNPLWSDHDAITREVLLDSEPNLTSSTLLHLADSVECKMRFVGLVAYEDIVPDTIPAMIQRIQASGIKFWLATVDPLEHAIGTAYSSNLVSPSMTELLLISDPNTAPGKMTYLSLNGRRSTDVIPPDPDIDPRVAKATSLSMDDIHDQALASALANTKTPVMIAAEMDTICTRLRIELFDYASRYLNQPKEGKIAVFVDAVSLELILNDASMSKTFYQLCNSADCIVAGGCSPEQKARIVRFIKTKGGHLSFDMANNTIQDCRQQLCMTRGVLPRLRIYRQLVLASLSKSLFALRWVVRDQTVTLAVARAACDIAMMSNAHVGIAVGNISLTHPNEAVLCSDYSIPKFRMLSRLILVHGHWNYHRLCVVAQLSMYKSVLLPTITLLHGFFNGFSGVLFIREALSDVFNLFLTLLPVLMVGISERDVADDVAEIDSRIYFQGGCKRGGFNLSHVLQSVVNGICHAIIIFILTMASINALTSMGFTNLPAIFATSAVDNNGIGSLYASGILVFVATAATANVKSLQSMTSFSVNVAFVASVSMVGMMFWITIAGSMDWTFHGDEHDGIQTYPYVLIVSLIAVFCIVLDITMYRIRYIISPSFFDRVRALEMYVRKLRVELILAKAIDASVSFSDMFNTLRIRLQPYTEGHLMICGNKADRFNGTFMMLSPRVWESISDQRSLKVVSSDPVTTEQLKSTRSYSGSSANTESFVDQTRDGISVRRLSVIRQRTMSIAPSPHPTIDVNTEQDATSASQATSTLIPRISHRASLMMLRNPSLFSQQRRASTTSQSENIVHQTNVRNFTSESKQPMSKYSMRLSTLSLKFKPDRIQSVDPAMVKRSEKECEEREFSYSFLSEMSSWRGVHLRLGLLGLLLISYSLWEVNETRPWGTARVLLGAIWMTALIVVLDQYRSRSTRLFIACLTLALCVLKTATLWPMSNDVVDKIGRDRGDLDDLTKSAYIRLLPLALFPYLIFNVLSLNFIDSFIVIIIDFILMNVYFFIGPMLGDIVFEMSPLRAALFDSSYLIVAIICGARCYAWERSRRILFLQEQRFRVLFHLSSSLVHGMVPDSESDSNTISQKLSMMNGITGIDQFRSYIAGRLSSIPTATVPDATVIVIGIDNLPRLIQHRTPSQAIFLISKVHETISISLQRSVATVDLHLTAIGAGQGAIMVAYAGLDKRRQCDSAVEMVRIAVQLSELNDPRTSHSLFGVMITLVIGIHTGRLVQGPIPSWDVAEDDQVPPLVYSGVIGEAIIGARAIQSMGEAGQIILSAATYKLVRHLYTAKPIMNKKKQTGSALASSNSFSEAPDSSSTTTSEVFNRRISVASAAKELDNFSKTTFLLRAHLPIANHKRMFRTIVNCFTGYEVVNLLLTKNVVISRFDGVNLGNSLIMRNVLVHAVKPGREFVDSQSELYRFRISHEIDIGHVLSVVKRTIAIGTTKHWFRSYPGTFTGRHFIDCLIAKNICTERQFATQIGSYLTSKSIIQCAVDPRQPFSDDNCPFRFNRAERLDDQALALGLIRNLDLKRRTFRGRTYARTFLGREAVSFMLEAGLAQTLDQALDFGNFLKSCDKLSHVCDPTVPFLNTSDLYVITIDEEHMDKSTGRGSLQLSSFLDNVGHYRLTASIKSEKDFLERSIDENAFVKNLGVPVRMYEQEAQLMSARVPIRLMTAAYDIQKLRSDLSSLPWESLETDYQTHNSQGLLKRLASGYDKALVIAGIELLTMATLAFEPAGFALLVLYLIIGCSFSFLIQSPVWSSYLFAYLERGTCKAAVALLRGIFQAINIFGLTALLTSRNAALRCNFVTTVLAISHVVATLQNPGIPFLHSLAIGTIFLIQFGFFSLIVWSYQTPDTQLYLVAFAAIVVHQLVSARNREVSDRRVFYFEWVGNRHRQTLIKLLARVVPRPIATALGSTFEPQAWSCNNVAIAQIEFTDIPKLLDRYPACPHQSIDVLSKVFESFTAICHEFACMSVLSAGSSYMFVCGLKHAQEEFEFDDDHEPQAGSPVPQRNVLLDAESGPFQRISNAVMAIGKISKKITAMEAQLGLETGDLPISVGVEIGGVLSAVLPGATIRHSIYGSTVDMVAQLALSCPSGLIHCGSTTKRILSRRSRSTGVRFAFAGSRKLIPNESTFFVRHHDDPFPAKFSDDVQAQSAITSVKSTIAVSGIAKRMRKQHALRKNHRQTKLPVLEKLPDMEAPAEVEENGDEVMVLPGMPTNRRSSITFGSCFTSSNIVRNIESVETDPVSNRETSLDIREMSHARDSIILPLNHVLTEPKQQETDEVRDSEDTTSGSQTLTRNSSEV